MSILYDLCIPTDSVLSNMLVFLLTFASKSSTISKNTLFFVEDRFRNSFKVPGSTAKSLFLLSDFILFHFDDGILFSFLL